MHRIRKDFDLKKLFNVNLNISDLSIQTKLWEERTKIGAFVKITGKYGHGSSGADDAKYIKWTLNELFDHPDFFIDGVVIDVSDLEYEWGDDLYLEPPKSVPFRVFLKEEQREAYLYIVSEDKMRFHQKTALAEINDEIKKT